MGKSRKISLEDVANEAGISRATIYRYFSNVDLLITEASLDIHYRTPEELTEEVAGLSLGDRIHYLQDYYNTLAQEHEIPFRRYLSTALAESVTNKKKIRGARRLEALHQALAPYRSEIPNRDYQRLINIASVLMGIDALTVSKDVCGLNNRETSALLGWAMDRILDSMNLDQKL
jgi:AcrR family transcriptional regulator